MNKLTNKAFLYAGLALLLIAFIIRWAGIGASYYLFWGVLGIAIVFKSIFLVLTFCEKGLKLSWGLRLILIGVLLIVLSLIFKYIIFLPLIRDILFYGAIMLKITGLILLITQKKL